MSALRLDVNFVPDSIVPVTLVSTICCVCSPHHNTLTLQYLQAYAKVAWGLCPRQAVCALSKLASID